MTPATCSAGDRWDLAQIRKRARAKSSGPWQKMQCWTGGFLEWGYQNGWLIMGNPIKMDDLGVALFHETSTWGTAYFHTVSRRQNPGSSAQRFGQKIQNQHTCNQMNNTEICPEQGYSNLLLSWPCSTNLLQPGKGKSMENPSSYHSCSTTLLKLPGKP